MSDQSTSSARRAAAAAFVGTTIEWYDFYVYATAASLVFGKLFFPESSPAVAAMAAFATYAVGFLVRPLGGVVFGHFGDRVGRKAALVTTLLIMGGATFAVGILPTYAAAGVLAPVLLVVLRFAQGLAVGGEWGGAVLMAVEHAPERSRTFYGSFAQLGNPAGALLATGIFGLLAGAGDEVLLGWGWRLPFLLSAVLVIVGLVVRLKVEESPQFVAVRKRNAVVSLPIGTALRSGWRTILLGLGALPAATGGYYVVTTFLLAYSTTDLGVDEQLILYGLSIAAIVELVATVGLAWLGDRFGDRRVVIVGLVVVAVLAAPQFLVLSSGSAGLIISMLALMRLAMSAIYGPMAAILSGMFAPEARYTSISLSYSLAAAIFGGFAPLACTALVAAFGGVTPVIVLLVAMCLISIVCLRFAPRYEPDRDQPVPEVSRA
ncbi:MFS transporter [Pseudonocardia sp. TRM90224]|uniref:MFS transporter n=1 Tax=Pseudonocardia sp. TRM90224 TaxID=2812678 RepID=UPI001E5181AD|nr:MFS transporter [Pseudonocardia sp. TRM90224]